MNPLIFRMISIVIFLFCFSGAAPAQLCDECSNPRIALYDSDVQVPKPTNPDSIAKWYNLFWPAAVARSELVNNDPTADCITWMDGAMINADELQGGTLLFGQEYANVPPPGEVKTADYLLWSVVTGSAGNYHFSLFIEAAQFTDDMGARLLVKIKSYDFTSTLESATAAGMQAAADFMPVLDIIRQWEVNERNNDEMIAILDRYKPEEIIIKPEKIQVDTSETIDVEVTMIDCDGVPLSNREIFFHDFSYFLKDELFSFSGTTGGKVTPDTVRTDNSGKVIVKFKADNTPGTANIVVWYPHYKPYGKPYAFQGSAMVQVTAPPSNYWLFNAQLSQASVTHYDTAYSGNKYNGKYEVNSTGTIKAVIENTDADPVNNFTYSTDYMEPHAVSVSGISFFYGTSRLEESSNGTLLNADINSESGLGFLDTCTSITIDYTPIAKGMSVSLAGLGKSSWGGKGYDGEWFTYNEEYNGVSFGLGVSCGEGDGCTITKNNNMYSASGKYESDYQSLSPFGRGTEYTHEEYNFNATLIPYGSYTSADDGLYNELFPSSFSLGQNYPNPFNPSTNITIQIKEKEFVTLKIYNLLGVETAVLINGNLATGTYKLSWNAGGLPSGVYFYQLKAGNYKDTKKMILIK